MRNPAAVRASLLALAALLVVPFAAPAAEATAPGESGFGLLQNMGTRVAKPEVAPATDDGFNAIQRMKVPEGLKISLWAAEPMLANAVAFDFDEKGRLFAAETYRYRTSVLDIRDYMWTLEDDLANRTIEDQHAGILKHFGPEGLKELSIETEQVRLVEDRNGDGVADHSTVYADGFNSPLDGIASGVIARRGKVWFTNIPSLWQFTGTDKAETRKELSRGYGVRFNFTGHDFHGLAFGPDGKLYYSVGDRGAHATATDGTVASTPDMGAVFRSNPDGTQLELYAWGLRNPQELVFTENGDLFTGDNDSDQGDEERLVQVVEGGDSGWRIGYQFSPLERAGPWNIEKLWHQRHEGQPAYLLPPIANLEDGPSGITYYPGTGLNPSYAGTFFITSFKGSIARSGIQTYKLKPDGASYAIADAKPFLSSALPTDVAFGPDGRLYISDWADGWPKSKRGRIYAISDPAHENDAILKETKALIGGDWTKRSPDELATLLGHADWRVRLEAQFELAERGSPSIATLAGVASKTTSPALARRHAIWGLGQIGAGSGTRADTAAFEPLRPLLKDADAEVRAQILKVMGNAHVAARDVALFTAALKDESPRVRFFAAQGLGKTKAAVGSAEARAITPALLDALAANADQDHYLRHALVMGLAGAKDTAALDAAMTHSSRSVRLGVLLAQRRLGRAEIQKFLADSDPYIVREAAIAINDAPITAAYPALAAMLDSTKDNESIGLRAINAHFRLGQPANANALAKYAARTDVVARLRAEATTQLGNWATPPARDRVVGIYRPLAQAGTTGLGFHTPGAARDALAPVLATLLDPQAPPALQAAAIQAVEKLRIPAAADTLLAVLKDENQPVANRATALSALDLLKDPRLPEAVQLASASSAARLRLAALPIAARLSPDAAAPVLANFVAKGTVDEQKAAFTTLGTLKHASVNPLLTEQLKLLAAGKVAPAVELELMEAAAQRDDATIKQLLTDQAVANAADTANPLASFRSTLQGGNRVEGQKIFEAQPTLACIRCHRIGNGPGGDAGPNLAGIASQNTREQLLESILKPNAKISPGFDTVVVTRKSGGNAAGTVASETADTLTLRDPESKLIAIPKADIERRDSAPSGMPEIYGAILTKSEIRDVVEYLTTLRAAPGAPAATANAAPALTPSPMRALRGLPTTQ